MNSLPTGAQSTHSQQPAACRRRYGRVRVGNVRCTLGRVMDISAGGLRVLNRSMTPVKTNSIIPVQVEAAQGWVQASVRVAWVRPAGMFRQEMGLEIVEIEDEGRQALLELARRDGCGGGFSLMPETEKP
jgi:hypothetical protein